MSSKIYTSVSVDTTAVAPLVPLPDAAENMVYLTDSDRYAFVAGDAGKHKFLGITSDGFSANAIKLNFDNLSDGDYVVTTFFLSEAASQVLNAGASVLFAVRLLGTKTLATPGAVDESVQSVDEVTVQILGSGTVTLIWQVKETTVVPVGLAPASLSITPTPPP